MHQDLVAKSKRITDTAGNVVSTIELDPWGGETNRSSNEAFQPRKFTTYERDSIGSDDAMHRRYNRWWARFEQPDPYGGSYDMTDPQSFNRYSYVQNDPVNFVDPLGLDPIGALGRALADLNNIGPGTVLVTIPIGPSNEFHTEIDPEHVGFWGGGITPLDPPRDSTLTRSEIDQLRTDLATRLKDLDCAKFVQGVLMQIKAVTGTAAYSNNILSIFDQVKKQGGFGRRAGAFTAEAANGVGGGAAFVNINYSIAANSSRIFNSASSGRSMIHELLHVAANSSMTISHFQMASAAYAATGKKGPAPTTDGTKAADRRNSNYFDDKLFDACHVR